METVYFSLGSNLGNRQENLNRALDLLSQRLRVEQISSIYDTEPVGDSSQPRFLNMVCKVTTGLEPKALLALVKGIEAKMGRLPNTTNLPRPIDIDILLYGNRVVNEPELIIPHPRLTERAFVVIPLAEIAADLVHPVTGQVIKELAKSVAGAGGVLKCQNR